jgi:uncharacterized damage-inducible protein DinB
MDIDDFIQSWEYESGVTTQLLRTLPADRLDFRPHAQGRSLGELAWHLAELEAIMSTIAVQRNFRATPPPGLERPDSAEALTHGYERIHHEAVERVRRLTPEQLEIEFPFVLGNTIRVWQVLRFPLLHHHLHHRGQLMMMIRMAGGVPSRVYGPNREDDAAVRREIEGGSGSGDRGERAVLDRGQG